MVIEPPGRALLDFACTQKSGNSAICGILGYGEPLKTHGLNLLSAPGNGLVAATALERV